MLRLVLALGLSLVWLPACDDVCECVAPPVVSFFGPSPIVVRPGTATPVDLRSNGFGSMSVSLDSVPPGAFVMETTRKSVSNPIGTSSRKVSISLAADAPATATGTLHASVDGGAITNLPLVVGPAQAHLRLFPIAPEISVDVGETREGRYRMENTGAAELVVSGISVGQLVPGMSLVIGGRDTIHASGLTTFAEPYRVAPGGELYLVGSYTPVTLEPLQQHFALISNAVHDEMMGEDAPVGAFALNSGGCLTSASGDIDFGDVRIDEVAFADLKLTLCDDASFVWLEELDLADISPSPFALVTELELPRAVREPLTVQLSFWPREVGPFETYVSFSFGGSVPRTIGVIGNGVRP